ncbi:Predicted glycosyl transferase [Roseivivax lentus]|uniref:Predicted glycosyl transferase n=1 Tax=Roseivivax lentus TaxID=633194 RepID=A0A1N7PE57_9RHOB|nr:glycosyl transferase family 28 [Roseivivax lentus]SIT08925.1 Predicted glycosyl transferase [Roseivivax lentus]
MFERLDARFDPMPHRPAAPLRIMLYSHDTLGYGHLRRNLLLAAALSEIEPRPEILLIGGMREAGAFTMPAGVDCVTLPAYAKEGDGSYRPRDLGGDLARLSALRSRTIRSAAEGFDPDLVIVDNVPRGAQFELDDTLHALRARGRARIVLGLRDVIDECATVRRQWLRQRNFETVRHLYDAVWIYGDAAFYDILSDCCMLGPLGGKAMHVGYLDPTGRRDADQAARDLAAVQMADPRPYIYCAVGGGRDGLTLCEAFAGSRMPDGHRGVLVTGTQMPREAKDRIAELTRDRDDLTVLPFLSEPIGVMANAARIVGMGGYNTTMEMLALDPPALIVPRCAPRREQVMRTERLAARGLVSMILPADLTSDALSAWMAAPAPRPERQPDMGGLARVQALASKVCSTAPALVA